MCHASNKNRETTPNERNWTTKLTKKIKTLGEKEPYKYLGILEDDTIK